MQSGVGRDQTFLIGGGERGLPGALQFAEVLDVLWCRPLRGEPGGLRLEQSAHREKLISLFIGGGVHECAEGGPQIHPALTVHALQRFPHRLPADP